jgi:FtsH-binding integral membrane protein
MDSYNQSVSRHSLTQTEQRNFLVRTYAWMGAALAASAVSAFLSASTGFFLSLIRSAGIFGFVLIYAAEIALVVGLTASIRKISVSTAKILFLLYSVLNGISISSIFFVYSLNSVASCFVSSAAMFFFMALYGSRTKKSLVSAGNYLRMALAGIVIASVLNGILFLFGFGSGLLDWLISVVSVAVFTGLTAYDSQKIISASQRADSSDDYKKIAVYGALELYLDFINIFLSILRLFGRRNS